ncbi:MAG: hypothetical protein RMK99_03180 [Anaerolineales bacterium]|nr:hypothetical protein [Anaerolineales bacterium]
MQTSRTWDYWALWVVALVSLALNLGLIAGLLNVRRQAAETAQTVAASLGRLRASTLTYTVQVNETVPVQVAVPINERLTVPIDTQLPIDTFVNVPIEVPFIGSRMLSLPIKAVVPVKFETTFPVKLTVPISTSVPVELNVPIRIVVADTPLDDSLAEAEAYLKKFAADLGAPALTPTPARPSRTPTTSTKP